VLGNKKKMEPWRGSDESSSLHVVEEEEDEKKEKQLKD